MCIRDRHYKNIPKFVVSYLKKIVHQDEINGFLNESKDRLGVDFLEACMGFLDAKVDVKVLLFFISMDDPFIFEKLIPLL